MNEEQLPSPKRSIPRAVSRCALAGVTTFVALSLHGCTNYEIEVDFTCTERVAAQAGMAATSCMAWKQKGKMSSAPACFPGNATVVTPAGPKAISEITIGDELLGFNHASQLQEFSPVRAWLHRDLDADVAMVRISTAGSGDLVASGFHLVATGRDGSYSFARDLRAQAGQYLVSAAKTGNSSVASVAVGTGNGLYAPLTRNSNFFVGDGNGRFLAHSLAHVSMPHHTALALHGILSAAEFFSPRLHEVPASARQYLHPVCATLLNLIGVPVTESVAHFESVGGMPRRLKATGGGNDQQKEEESAMLGLSVFQPPVVLLGSSR